MCPVGDGATRVRAGLIDKIKLQNKCLIYDKG